jgi:hypothetical protein
MSEEGVNVVGTPRSRSMSPNRRDNEEEKPKEKKFLNGWTSEQERLMADWSDIASCYRWLHDKSEKTYHNKTLWINLPVIILSTLGGTANFGIQSLFENDETAKKYASFGIGGISLLAGMLTTVGNYLRYAQLEESHRVASISWGKFQRLLAVELALNPDDRMDSMDFLKICRSDLDRLIEQSPPIPKEAVQIFEERFGSIKELKKPDICGALEHTNVFKSSETRLKQAAVEAALMLKRRKQTLHELVTPDMERKIKTQVEERLNEALDVRKKKIEEEIELARQEAIKSQEEFNRVLEERKRKIEEEIEIQKIKLFQEKPKSESIINKKEIKTVSKYENKIKTNLIYNKYNMNESKRKLEEKKSSIYEFEGMKDDKINNIIQSSSNNDSNKTNDDNHIIIIDK